MLLGKIPYYGLLESLKASQRPQDAPKLARTALDRAGNDTAWGDYVLKHTNLPALATAAHMAQPNNWLSMADDAGQYWGDKTLDYTGSPAAATAVHTGLSVLGDPLDTVPLAYGGAAALGVGGLGWLMKQGGDLSGLRRIAPLNQLGAVGGRARARAQARRVAPPPSIRGLPVDEAVAAARREPHLRLSAEGAEGKYIGGPRDVKTKQQLNKLRKEFDAGVALDPRGGDWYDRYRADVNEVTGSNPLDNLWMSKQHGQWSAGVSPQGEIGFVLGENNGTLAGFPRKTGRPGPHKAHNLAAIANDPDLYWMGPKTGEYQAHITPESVLKGTATGVNDFRYAREWRYTEPSGIAQTGGLNPGQHAFLDYETALAVDRANKSNLGGRSNWTGEQLQAAPWVRQKADDLFGNGNGYRKRAKEALAHSKANDTRPEVVEQFARDLAFRDANKTIGDFFPKHTAHATYESMPGPNTGNLPGLESLDDAQRAAIAADPRSTLATAAGGRDAIYSGLRYGDTGVAMRVRPTVDSQGIYQPPNGPLEMNPGEVARPLVGIETLPAQGYNNLRPEDFGPRGMRPGIKQWPKGDRAIIEAGETLRAAITGQDAGAAHSTFAGGRPLDQRSVRIPMDRKLSRAELLRTRDVFDKYGLPDVVDTGSGVTGTSFYSEPGELSGKRLNELAEELNVSLPGETKAVRVNVDSAYMDLVDKWKAGEGSGEVSQAIIDKVNVTPELRSAFDNNPEIAVPALNYIERDAELAKKYGTTIREDLKQLRKIVASGRGWIGRLEDAVKKGGVVPAVAAAFLGAAYSTGSESEL